MKLPKKKFLRCYFGSLLLLMLGGGVLHAQTQDADNEAQVRELLQQRAQLKQEGLPTREVDYRLFRSGHHVPAPVHETWTKDHRVLEFPTLQSYDTHAEAYANRMLQVSNDLKEIEIDPEHNTCKAVFNKHVTDEALHGFFKYFWYAGFEVTETKREK